MSRDYKGYHLLAKMCKKFPHRQSGTRNGSEAVDYLYTYLQKRDFDVKKQNFSLNAWRRGKAELFLYIPNTKQTVKLDVMQLAYNPSVKDLQGEILNVGNGLRQDFIQYKEEIKNKILLVNIFPVGKNRYKIKNPHRSDKLRWAKEMGAKAVLFVNRYPGRWLATGTVSRKDEPAQIPALMISFRDATKIRNLLQSDSDKTKNGKTYRNIQKSKIIAKLSSLSRILPSAASNLLINIPALSESREYIVIGAHLDTWDLSCGAIDNGIGAFALLDIAEKIRKFNLNRKRNLIVALWMGEEQGQLGSSSFIRDWRKNKKSRQIRYYVNVDMAANPKGFDLEGRQEQAEFLRFIGEQIKAMGIPFKNKQQDKFSQATDNLPFALQGIPVVQTMGELSPKAYRYYHSQQDNFFLVNRRHMLKSSQVLLVLLGYLTNSAGLPAKKLDQSQLDKFLDKQKAHFLKDYDYGNK